MAELPLQVVGLEWDRVPIPGYPGIAFSWQRTGVRLIRDDLLDLTLKVGRKQSLGLETEYRRLSLDGVGAGSWTRLSLLMGANCRVADEWVLGWRVHLGLARGGGQGFSGRSTLAAMDLLGPGIGLALLVDQDAGGMPRPGADLLLRVQPGLGLSLRLDVSTAALGPGLSYRVGHLLLRTSHTLHPALGVTHRVLLSVLFSPCGIP